MSIIKKEWGAAKSGEKVNLYILDNGKMNIAVSDFGATLVNVFVPDKAGEMRDVVWGYDCVGDYET
ncbi:MAG: hypothetical protein IJP17_02295 [Clostridia bacterium]|nr:hypothetical protein [Clostridia bacterium]